MVASTTLCAGGCGAYARGGFRYCFVCNATAQRTCERCGVPVPRKNPTCPPCRAYLRKLYVYERNPRACMTCAAVISAEEYWQLRDASIIGIRDPKCRDCVHGPIKGSPRPDADPDPVQVLTGRHIAGTDAPCWRCGGHGIIVDDLGARCAACGRDPKEVVEA